jgi:GAF domain
MSDPGNRRNAEQVSADGERHGRDLQKVNERLRELITSLRSEKARLAPDGRAVPAVTPAPTASAEPAHLEARRLASELALAREAVEHANAERERLRERLDEIEAENRRVCDEYVAVQERSSEIAQLYVALERIHGATTRADTLTALQEIIINVIGSEELAIFERRGDELVLAQSFGVDPGALRTVAVGAGAIGRAAASGTLYVAGRGGEPDAREADLSACVPLRVGDRTEGVIAIWRLLGHKPGLDDQDQAMFDLLSAHAGVALGLRARAERAREA